MPVLNRRCTMELLGDTAVHGPRHLPARADPPTPEQNVPAVNLASNDQLSAPSFQPIFLLPRAASARIKPERTTEAARCTNCRKAFSRNKYLRPGFGVFCSKKCANRTPGATRTVTTPLPRPPAACPTSDSDEAQVQGPDCSSLMKNSNEPCPMPCVHCDEQKLRGDTWPSGGVCFRCNIADRGEAVLEGEKLSSQDRHRSGANTDAISTAKVASPDVEVPDKGAGDHPPYPSLPAWKLGTSSSSPTETCPIILDDETNAEAPVCSSLAKNSKQPFRIRCVYCDKQKLLGDLWPYSNVCPRCNLAALAEAVLEGRTLSNQERQWSGAETEIFSTNGFASPEVGGIAEDLDHPHVASLPTLSPTRCMFCKGRRMLGQNWPYCNVCPRCIDKAQTGVNNLAQGLLNGNRMLSSSQQITCCTPSIQYEGKYVDEAGSNP